MLYPKYAADLKSCVDALLFSIQSQDEDTHNNTVGAQSYSKVIESIKIAKKLRQKISLLHTVTNKNIVDLPKMISFAQANMCVIRLNPCFSYFGNQNIESSFLITTHTYLVLKSWTKSLIAIYKKQF